jgi:D-alanyl-D-alanine carboxypeptidase
MEALIEASLWANPGAPQPAARLGREPEAAAAATPRGRLETPSLLAQPRLVRGSPPSTLERQAASLAGDEISAPRSSAAPGGGMAIQVGAFQSAGEAQRRLAWVREHASAVVGAREAVTQPIKQGEKLFYRARFAGFDNAAAASACKELRALKVDCLIMRPD